MDHRRHGGRQDGGDVGQPHHRQTPRRQEPQDLRAAAPAGALRTVDIAAPAAASLAIFFVAAAMLNTLALLLAPVAVAYLAVYPYTKRRTWAANLMLGGALGMAPSAAWIGVTGSLSWQPVLLSAAVALWASSFDILYHVRTTTSTAERGCTRLRPDSGFPPPSGGSASSTRWRWPPSSSWACGWSFRGRTSWAGQPHWRCWRTSTAWSPPATSQG